MGLRNGEDNLSVISAVWLGLALPIVPEEQPLVKVLNNSKFCNKILSQCKDAKKWWNVLSFICFSKNGIQPNLKTNIHFEATVLCKSK